MVGRAETHGFIANLSLVFVTTAGYKLDVSQRHSRQVNSQVREAASPQACIQQDVGDIPSPPLQ